MKRFLVIALLLVLTCGMCSCFLFEPHEVESRITTYYSDSPVESARFFIRKTDGTGEYDVEELDEDRISELVDKMDSFTLIKHFGHTDYFWGGSYGVEMTLEDGTYLRYDGTKLELSKTPYDAEYDPDARIEDDFIECSNEDYWDAMTEFFTLVEENREDVNDGY